MKPTEFLGFSIWILALGCTFFVFAYEHETAPESEIISHGGIQSQNQNQKASRADAKPSKNKQKRSCQPSLGCISAELKQKFSKQVETLKVNLEQLNLELDKSNPPKPDMTNAEWETRFLSDMKKFKGGLEVINVFLKDAMNSQEFFCIFSKKCWKIVLDKIETLIKDAEVLTGLERIGNGGNFEARKVVLKQWLRRARKVFKKVNASIQFWNLLAQN